MGGGPEISRGNSGLLKNALPVKHGPTGLRLTDTILGQIRLPLLRGSDSAGPFPVVAGVVGGFSGGIGAGSAGQVDGGIEALTRAYQLDPSQQEWQTFLNGKQQPASQTNDQSTK